RRRLASEDPPGLWRHRTTGDDSLAGKDPRALIAARPLAPGRHPGSTCSVREDVLAPQHRNPSDPYRLNHRQVQVTTLSMHLRLSPPVPRAGCPRSCRPTPSPRFRTTEDRPGPAYKRALAPPPAARDPSL